MFKHPDKPSAKVIEFDPPKWHNDMPADQVLHLAKGQLDHCLLAGITTDGDPYIATSIKDTGKLLKLLVLAQDMIEAHVLNDYYPDRD